MFFLIRHGERADFVNDPKEHKKVIVPCDPPLTTYGHQMAFETGEYLKIQLERFKLEKRCSLDAKIVLISSPFYRCLQTTKMIAKGVGLENLYSKNIFVEDAIGEYWSTICGLNKYTPQKRFFSNLNEQLEEELFSELKPQHNTFFDYEKNPVFKPHWEENMIKSKKRFLKVYETMTNTATESKNWDKIFVLCSHGISFDACRTHLDNNTYPDFCCIYLIEQDVKQSKEKGYMKYKQIIRNHYAYKKR